MFERINKSAGQIARVLLALLVIVILAIVIAYIVVKRAEKPPVPPPPENGELLPVYETTIDNLKFVFLEATDIGSTLYGSKSRQPDWQKDIKSTERFIELTVGAQNTGKENTEEEIWDIGNIVDNEGRNFVPLDENKIRNWLPEENLCGTILKPSFEPTPCIKIYEVAKISKGLKAKVMIFEKSRSDKIAGESLLDIKLMP